MAGLVSAIHEATPFAKDVSNSEPRFIMDARVKPAHDPRGCGSPQNQHGQEPKVRAARDGEDDRAWL